jgi:hypothetical protein
MRSIYGRRAGAFLLGVGLLLTIVTPVAATKPDRVPAGNQSFTVGAGELCPFAIQWVPVVDREKFMVFYDRDGNFVREWISGASFTKLTNLDSGKSVILNTSGPGPLTFNDGVLVIGGGGNGLVGLYPTDAGGPALWATRGPWQLVFDANFHVTSASLPRNRTDMCAVLA